MPGDTYGVWKAMPIGFAANRKGPEVHGTLHFADGLSERPQSALINVKSRATESRVVYWIKQDFRHPIIKLLPKISKGWHPAESLRGVNIDYIKAGFVPMPGYGYCVPYNRPGDNSNIVDFLEPLFEHAVAKRATVYVFGDMSEGIVRNVHRNQGSAPDWASQDGAYQDGAVIMQFEDGHWEALFIAFSSQAVETNEWGKPDGLSFYEFLKRPHAIEGYLAPKSEGERYVASGYMPRPAVSIIAAYVNTTGKDDIDNPEVVFLRNNYSQPIWLADWSIENDVTMSHEISPNSFLMARGGTNGFGVPGVSLSRHGGSILLKSSRGETIDRVEYTFDDASKSGKLVFFQPG